MKKRYNGIQHPKGLITFSFLSLLVVTALFISSCGNTLMQAQEAYNDGYFGKAAQLFEKAAKSKKLTKEQKVDANMMAAESYRLNSDYEKARRLYEKVLKSEPKNTKALYMNAVMLFKQEKYRESIDAFKKYLEEVPGDFKAENKIIGAEMALRWTPDSSRFKVEKFKPANSPDNDFGPMIGSKRDNILLFASDREGGMRKKDLYPGTMKGWSDMWYVEKKGRKGKERWEKPVLMKTSSTKYNEGGVTFDSKYGSMYMTQCGGADGKNRKCKIYEMKKVGQNWELGPILDFCANDSFNYGHPALSPDGTKMYFSSDRPGGEGLFDIWVVTYSKRSKSWGDPVNLGPSVNTPGHEQWPYINQHDNKLYWSSDGLPGIGGLDIFSATPTEDITVWEEIENLKEPLNSGGDDFGITFWETDPNRGYFTSNRGEKKNNDDIYSFFIDSLVITLSGVITDCSDKKILAGATITITNDRDTSRIVVKADANGAYRVRLKEKTNYEIDVKYPEKYYFPAKPVKRTTNGIKFSTELKQDFCLENPLDQLVTLPIFYDLDKAFIRPDAARILDTFARDVMLKYPMLIAELGSHTDCRATMDYNVDLARRRADSAKAYLVKVHKIDPKRINAVGYGEKELVNDCKCEGTEVSGYTEFKEWVDEKGRPRKTRKSVVVKKPNGDYVSYYEDYAPNEIKTINGKKYVACDEFQHQQNRRTTVRFSLPDQSSRVKVDQGKDANNTNGKGKDTGAVVNNTPTKPPVDETNAVRVRLIKSGNNNMANTMVNDQESTTWAVDLVGKYTAITPELAAQWYNQKLINKGDFQDGDKFVANGVKLPSNKFILKKVEIGGYVVENVTILITDKVEQPTLGKTFFKPFKTESYIKDNELVLIPKKAPKKPASGN